MSNINYAAVQDALQWAGGESYPLFRIFTCHQVLYHLDVFHIKYEADVKVLTELLRIFRLFLYTLINFMDFFSSASSFNFHKNIVDIFGGN